MSRAREPNCNGWTPTQNQILKLLSDSEPHSLEELQSCLWDERSPPQAVHYHLACIRRKLRERGKFVLIFEPNGYRLVSLMKLRGGKSPRYQKKRTPKTVLT